jgi:hypothetical protein
MTFQGDDDDIKTVLTKPKANCHKVSTLKYDPLHRIDIDDSGRVFPEGHL